MTRQQWDAEVLLARQRFAQHPAVTIDEEAIRQMLRAMVRGAIEARLLAACAGVFVYCDRIEQRLSALTR